MAISSRFTYASGVSGAYTVPAGQYVTGFAAHATGSGAYCTVAAQGPDTSAGVAGSQIPIPAGSSLQVTVPQVTPSGAGNTGGQDIIGDGSVLAFSGTDSYLVTMWIYESL
jgi:hypothetical protein